MNSIEKIILKQENDLLKSEIRKSSQKIKELLADEFVEFCSSGNEYRYEDGDIFQAQNNNEELNWSIVDFKTKELSHECILATYRLIKNDEVDESKKYSLRSSIWKNYCGKWKMFFHQGTVLDK